MTTSIRKSRFLLRTTRAYYMPCMWKQKLNSTVCLKEKNGCEKCTGSAVLFCPVSLDNPEFTVLFYYNNYSYIDGYCDPSEHLVTV